MRILETVAVIALAVFLPQISGWMQPRITNLKVWQRYIDNDQSLAVQRMLSHNDVSLSAALHRLYNSTISYATCPRRNIQFRHGVKFLSIWTVCSYVQVSVPSSTDMVHHTLQIHAPISLGLNITVVRFDSDYDPVTCREKVMFILPQNEGGDGTFICGNPYLGWSSINPHYNATIVFRYTYPRADYLNVTLHIHVTALVGNQANIPMSSFSGGYDEVHVFPPSLQTVNGKYHAASVISLTASSMEGLLSMPDEYRIPIVSISAIDCRSDLLQSFTVYDGPYAGVLSTSGLTSPFQQLMKGSCLDVPTGGYLRYNSSIGDLTVVVRYSLHHKGDIFRCHFQNIPANCPGEYCTVAEVEVAFEKTKMWSFVVPPRPLIQMVTFVTKTADSYIKLNMEATEANVPRQSGHRCRTEGMFIYENGFMAFVCSGEGFAILNRTMQETGGIQFNTVPVTIALKVYPQTTQLKLTVLYTGTSCFGMTNTCLYTSYSVFENWGTIREMSSCLPNFEKKGLHLRTMYFRLKPNCCFQWQMIAFDDTGHSGWGCTAEFYALKNSFVKWHIAIDDSQNHRGCLGVKLAATDYPLMYISQSSNDSILPSPRMFNLEESITLTSSYVHVTLLAKCIPLAMGFRITGTTSNVTASRVCNNETISQREVQSQTQGMLSFVFEPFHTCATIYLSRLSTNYSFQFNYQAVQITPYNNKRWVRCCYINVEFVESSALTAKLKQDQLLYAVTNGAPCDTHILYRGIPRSLRLRDLSINTISEAFSVWKHSTTSSFRIHYQFREKTKAELHASWFIDYDHWCPHGGCNVCTRRKCYRVYGYPSLHSFSWNDADMLCRQNGSQLISIGDQEEWYNMAHVLDGLCINNVFLHIGLKMKNTSRVPGWEWTSGYAYVYSDWSDQIGVGVGGRDMAWPGHLVDIYSRFQPDTDQTMNCSAAFLASPYNPKWLRIPCNVSLVRALIICEDNSTDHRENMLRKRSPVECPRAWFQYSSFCLVILRLNRKRTPLAKVISWEELDLCKFGQTTGMQIRPPHFKMSFLHQLSGNSNRKMLFSKTGGNCSLVPSDIDGIMGGYSSVLKGPCEELIEQADGALCYVPVLDVDSAVCLPGHYRCQSGTCILNQYRCDGVSHCENNTDEIDCNDVCQMLDTRTGDVNCFTNCSRPSCLCSDHYYQCKVGGCVPWTNVCDCQEDCADGSDEDPCPGQTCTMPLYRNLSKYELGIFHCNDATNESIPVNLVNDTIPDCLENLADEEFYINLLTGIRQKEDSQCEKSGDIPCQDGMPRCFPTEDLCIFERQEPTEINYCRTGEHLRNCYDFDCPSHFKCPYSFCVPFYMTCDGRFDCPEGEDESNCEGPCQGLLRCASDGLCVHPRNIGDGSVHCKISGDDEVAYQHFRCLSHCDCRGLSATCAGHTSISPIYWNWQLNFLNYSATDFQLSAKNMASLPESLLSLDLSFNSIDALIPLDRLSELLYFYINHNLITSIGRSVFTHSPNLIVLDLVGNPISSIAPRSFLGLHKVSSLDLDKLDLQELFPATFFGLKNCLSLNLSNNRLRELRFGIFQGLNNLLVLDLRRNRLISLSADISRELSRIKIIHLDNGQYCCLFTKETACYAIELYDDDESCANLIPSEGARYLGWSIAAWIFTLNLGSLGWWSKGREMSVYGIAVGCLNIADMIMTFPLLLVLIMDFQSRGIFIAKYSVVWRDNIQCILASYLSLLSFQLSMTYLAIIYFLRLYAVHSPFKAKDIKPYKQMVLTTISSISLAIALGTWAFSWNGMNNDFRVKATNSLCNFGPSGGDISRVNVGYVALLLTNSLLYVVITICAWLMVYETHLQTRKMSEEAISNSLKRKKESRQLMIKIIVTWICTTVAYLGLPVSSAGSSEAASRSLNQWLAFLSLPLNSILNPVLYTFCTPQFISSLNRFYTAFCAQMP